MDGRQIHKSDRKRFCMHARTHTHARAHAYTHMASNTMICKTPVVAPNQPLVFPSFLPSFLPSVNHPPNRLPGFEVALSDSEVELQQYYQPRRPAGTTAASAKARARAKTAAGKSNDGDDGLNDESLKVKSVVVKEFSIAALKVLAREGVQTLPICRHTAALAAPGGDNTEDSEKEEKEGKEEKEESYLPSAELQAAASSAHALLSR